MDAVNGNATVNMYGIARCIAWNLPTSMRKLLNNGEITMQTIEEYKAYTKQLEGDVGKWHRAYDALMVERNQLVNKLKSTEKFLEAEREECDRWRQRAAELARQLKKEG